MREGTGAYDLVMMDDTWAPEFIGNGWLKPLPASLADADLVPSAVALGRNAAGALYALPIVGNVEMFAYRKDLLAKYKLQPPRNWDDVLKIAQTVGGADKSVSGVVFRGTKGNPVVTGFLPILWAYGGDVFDRAGNVTIDSREAQAALKTFLALKASAPKDVDVYGAAEVRDAQRHGRAVDRGLAGVGAGARRSGSSRAWSGRSRCSRRPGRPPARRRCSASGRWASRRTRRTRSSRRISSRT